jgi:tight adherence protein B
VIAVAPAALAVAALLVAVPGARAMRTSGLARDGRLAARAAGSEGDGQGGRRGARRVARRLIAVPAAAAAMLGIAGAAHRGAVVLLVPAAAVAGAAAVVGRDVRSRRRAAARHRDVSTAVRVLVGELESGARPAAALTAAADAGPAVSAVMLRAASAAASGDDVAAVLADAADDELALIGVAWRLGDATGAALAAVLARVCADFAAADAQRRSVAIALAGPRSSAFVLAGLPLLGIGLGAAMGARPAQFLTGDPAGRLLCCVGVVLDVAGVLWLRTILRRAERA